ncbi:MAG: hypothetical protein IK990_19225 [Ruminiclostridium sp.]|nr:hypothetical protein [Ruminiclostridium sp.]
MKKIRFRALAALLLVCCLFLAGCGSTGYTSSYNAVGFVHNNTDSKADMSFAEFQGTKVFELKFAESFSKSLIYSLRLETGNATIYYDTDGTKQELVKLSSGDRIDDKLKDLTCESMYIIVETDGKCLNGNFSFETKVL